MMPDSVKATYLEFTDHVGETVLIRRYTGQGTSRPHISVEVKARVTGYQEDELVGSIQQGDRKVIALVQDLIDASFTLPVIKGDKVVVGGKELNIETVDDNTRRIAGVLIAYEIRARG